MVSCDAGREPQETKQFEQTLDGAFELVAQEGTFELRRRREGSATPSVGIADSLLAAAIT